MRYITIPDPMNVSVTVKTAEGTEDKVLPYGLHDLNAQQVWTHESCHDDLASNMTFERVYNRFKGKKPGQVVALEDSDYEWYLPIVTMKGQKIRPDLAFEMNMIMRSVLSASSTELPALASKPTKKK